ncbi:MAG: cytochrome c maturation protein CcmE [Gemmatimonadetes bacterium]|nr:cytochrome c maturation protein CcmE [Gemmatimonadota bacterium]
MLAGLVAAGGAIWLLAFGGLNQNMVFFMTPSELQAGEPLPPGTSMRLGGRVKPGSVQWDAAQTRLRFVLTDEGAEISVAGSVAPPAMFREGMGVVVEGTYGPGQVFQADGIMIKHSNEYAPPGDGVDPSQTYRSLLESS